ncbi:MAG: phospholipid carrier-dependent glycosyltransferase [Chloroflexi bacterium]|nr:MAG: phospholipid carrier-dependent glycosyltransferase [Chloroflexota bacterium]MBL1193591.1 phospholipid carrier-dependent glycosyltransferase [Chloroflexota bacterium]NOH10882.1 phospholipid carrier-dependent glycosyltransferase [Chloroflexota bacterium]
MAALASVLKRLNLTIVLLIGLGVRLIGLVSRPIWYDEAFSLLVARGDTLAFPFATDVHPPLYYLLLSFWTALWGDSIAIARLFSIVLSLVVIFLAYQICLILFDKEIAVWSGLLLAVSPFLVHYAQEIRMYSLLTVFVLLAAYAYWRATREQGWLWWALFAASAALAQYNHNLAVFFLLPLASWPLLTRNWKNLFKIGIASTLALLVYIPWLLGLLAQVDAVRAAYWIEQPGVVDIFRVLIMFVSNLPVPPVWLPVSLASALFLVILAGWHTIKRYRQGHEKRQISIWLMMMAFLPMALMFLVSFWLPVFLHRAFLPSAVFFLIWLIWSFQGADVPKIIRNAAFGILLINSVVGIYMHYSYGGFPYVPYNEGRTAWLENVSGDEVIVHSNKLSMLPSHFLDTDRQHRYVIDAPGSGSDTLSEASQAALAVHSYESIADAANNSDGVWFIIFNQAIKEYQDLDEGTHPHLAWLQENYKLAESQQWGNLILYHFER